MGGLFSSSSETTATSSSAASYQKIDYKVRFRAGSDHPLTLVILCNTIASFACAEIFDCIHFSHINQTTRDTVLNYSSTAWKDVVASLKREPGFQTSFLWLLEQRAGLTHFAKQVFQAGELDPNFFLVDIKPPLWQACSHNNYEAAIMLLQDKRCDPNLSRRSGGQGCPMSYLRNQQNSSKVIRVFLEKNVLAVESSAVLSKHYSRFAPQEPFTTCIHLCCKTSAKWSLTSLLKVASGNEGLMGAVNSVSYAVGLTASAAPTAAASSTSSASSSSSENNHQEGEKSSAPSSKNLLHQLLESRDVDGLTPLHVAALGDHISCAEILISYGANVKASIEINQEEKARKKQLEEREQEEYKIAFAAQQEADSKQYNTKKYTPPNEKRVVAPEQKQGTFSPAELFPSRLGDMTEGNTVLHLLADYSDEKLLKVLVTAGADVNAKNSLGNTPLAHCVKQGKYQVAEHLLVNYLDKFEGGAAGLADLRVFDNKNEKEQNVSMVELMEIQFGSELDRKLAAGGGGGDDVSSAKRRDEQNKKKKFAGVCSDGTVHPSKGDEAGLNVLRICRELRSCK